MDEGSDHRQSAGDQAAQGKLFLFAAATVLLASAALAQTPGSAVPGHTTGSGTTAAGVIPLTEAQPIARLDVDPPLAAPLARGVVVLQYRAENIRIVPVFGPAATTVSPRVGHLHVSVDDLPWVWADASGVPVIIQNLPPGSHRVLVELATPIIRSLIIVSSNFWCRTSASNRGRRMRVATEAADRMRSAPVSGNRATSSWQFHSMQRNLPRLSPIDPGGDNITKEL
jgi:Family of unknown function (DUF6130)